MLFIRICKSRYEGDNGDQKQCSLWSVALGFGHSKPACSGDLSTCLNAHCHLSCLHHLHHHHRHCHHHHLLRRHHPRQLYSSTWISTLTLIFYADGDDVFSYVFFSLPKDRWSGNLQVPCSWQTLLSQTSIYTTIWPVLMNSNISIEFRILWHPKMLILEIALYIGYVSVSGHCWLV